jgi:ATP-dependent Clp protease ATP-binding subunit ClpC
VFERFTERALQVVVLAAEEAREFRRGYLDTEHVLLGLIREEEGVAARALGSLGVTLARARPSVEGITGRGEEPTSGAIPFTSQAKGVLERALSEAADLGHDYIGTEHILLGLVHVNEGVAARVLLAFDADADKIRNEVMHALFRLNAGPRSRVRNRPRTAKPPKPRQSPPPDPSA